jgi:hypothetical protein
VDLRIFYKTIPLSSPNVKTNVSLPCFRTAVAIAENLLIKFAFNFLIHLSEFLNSFNEQRDSCKRFICGDSGSDCTRPQQLDETAADTVQLSRWEGANNGM